MTHETRRGPGRPKREELSEQQRRVLDLLVDGKTNGEIGEALGISLDGAKYHVSAICERVGVATREEAAEWWRQQRGFAARFAVTRGWSKLPVLAKLALGGSAGTAAIAVVVAVVLLSGTDDGIPELPAAGSDGPGVAARLWVAVAMQDEPGDRGELVNMKLSVHGPDGWKGLGATRNVPVLALSPDARTIAMVEWWQLSDGPGPLGSQLVLVDTATGSRQVVDSLSNEMPFGPIVGWSPDSQLLAVQATSQSGSDVVVLARDGTVRAEIQDVEALSQSFQTPSAWSTDSHSLLLQQDEGLVIATVDGDIVARGEYAAIRAMAPNAIGWQPESVLTSGLVAYAWTGPDRFTATLGVQDPGTGETEAVLLEGRLDNGEIAWEKGVGGDVNGALLSIPGGGSGPYPEWVTESGQFAGSRTWDAAWHRPGMLSALLTPNDVGTPPGVVGADARLALFVAHDRQYSVVDLDLGQDYFERPLGPGTVALRGPQVRWDAVVVK